MKNTAPELFLKHVHLFSSIPDEHLQEIQQLTVTRVFKKNTFIVTQGDDSQSLYLVLSGHLKVIVNDEDSGKEVILKFLHRHDYFGELALFDTAPRSASVLTLEETQVALLPANHFMAYLNQHPEVALSILPSLASRTRMLSEHIYKLASLDTYGRVADLLKEQATEDENGVFKTPKMTHQDIASAVGASREMVTKILKELKVGDYIDIVNKQIIVNRELPKYW
ncbi:MAG: Crp/Fnr family transcriptional regulator [Gammaproteobacteria bacterium]|nr:Crp/Fnr family transcriptional regulator [Gammaproteobacteria bacterium]